MSFLFPMIPKITSSPSFDVTMTCFNDVRVTKNWILRILDESRSNFKFSPKILGIYDFDGVFGKL